MKTLEHDMREKTGGHRSSLITNDVATALQHQHRLPHQPSLPQSHHNGKLMIVLVGLPGRGKTFMGHILARHVIIHIYIQFVHDVPMCIHDDISVFHC